MKILKKKGFWNKIIVLLIILIFTNIIFPSNTAQAEVGGELLKPVNALVLKIGDGIIDLIHKVIFDSSTALLEYDTHTWDILVIIGAIAVGIAVAALVAVAAPVVLGALGSIATALGVTSLTVTSTIAIGTIVKIGVGATVIAGMYMSYSWFGEQAVFPIYEISPQEIFEGKIDLLNVNFFSNVQKNNQESNEEPDIFKMREQIAKQSNYEVDSVSKDSITVAKEITSALKEFGYTGEDIVLGFNEQTNIITDVWTDGEGISHFAEVSGYVASSGGMDTGDVTLTIYRNFIKFSTARRNNNKSTKTSNC